MMSRRNRDHDGSPAHEDMGSEGISPAFWIGFTVFILTVLALDLGVFHRKSHTVAVKEAMAWTALWVSLALGFAVFIHFWLGHERALEFLTGYVIEYALSVDNIFVFIVIFSFFAVPPEHQHRVLFWGIIGALVMRAGFIAIGAALLARFHWIIYVFGAFLLYTGVKLLKHGDADEVHPEKNPLIRVFRRFVPMVPEYHGGAFVVTRDGRRYATPLMLVLVAIEATDIVFAVDSIPAIFAVTKEPFIVYTSNIFAILGLRSLYFALAGMLGKFHYLKVGLAFVLMFVGVKMLAGAIGVHIPILLSPTAVVSMLGASVVASLVWPKAEPPGAVPTTPASAAEPLPTAGALQQSSTGEVP